MSFLNPRIVLLLLFVLPVRVAAGVAAANGSIQGLVVAAATKEPLVGVNVVVVGTTRGAVTDIDGRFAIRELPAGTYTLRVSAVGFLPVLRSDIVVSAARPAEVVVTLQDAELTVEGVEVTADYFQRLPDKPVSALIQSNEEIRRLPGGLEDVVRAISILPGVAQVQAGRNDLIVRGGAPSENLFIIDNIEVPNINHFGTQGASGGPLSYINLDFVRETEFSTGGFGARYGDRLSSVLTIDLRDGRGDRTGGKATISASQFGLNLEGPAGSAGTYLFSARRSYLDFIFRAAGFGFVPEYWDFLGKITMPLGPRDELTVLGIAALDNVRFFNDTQEQRFDNARILGSDQDQIVAGARWKRIFGTGFVTLTASRVDVSFSYAQRDSLLRPLFLNESREVESNMRGDVVLQVTRQTEISAGLQSKSLALRTDLVLPPFVTTFGDSLAIDERFRTGGWKGSGYVQVSHAFGGSRVTAGLRTDYFDIVAAPATIAPRLSLTHALTPTLNISLAAGRYYQYPSYVWLLSNPRNTGLGPMRADQLVVGADLTVRPDTKVRVELYEKSYGDYPVSLDRRYLVLVNTGAGFGGSEDGFASFGFDRLVNGGDGRARGVELLVQKRLSEVPCYGTVSVSYNRATFRALDGVSRPGSFDQRWIVNAGGGYVFDEHWEISTKFRLATGRPYTPFAPDGTQKVALLNTERVGTNASLDVRVDRRWQFDEWTLITYIDLQNVTNNAPNDVPRYDPRKRRAESDAAIGILPTIGISAEF